MLRPYYHSPQIIPGINGDLSVVDSSRNLTSDIITRVNHIMRKVDDLHPSSLEAFFGNESAEGENAITKITEILGNLLSCIDKITQYPTELGKSLHPLLEIGGFLEFLIEKILNPKGMTPIRWKEYKDKFDDGLTVLWFIERQINNYISSLDGSAHTWDMPTNNVTLIDGIHRRGIAAIPHPANARISQGQLGEIRSMEATPQTTTVLLQEENIGERESESVDEYTMKISKYSKQFRNLLFKKEGEGSNLLDPDTIEKRIKELVGVCATIIPDPQEDYRNAQEFDTPSQDHIHSIYDALDKVILTPSKDHTLSWIRESIKKMKNGGGDDTLRKEIEIALYALRKNMATLDLSLMDGRTDQKIEIMTTSGSMTISPPFIEHKNFFYGKTLHRGKEVRCKFNSDSFRVNKTSFIEVFDSERGLQKIEFTPLFLEKILIHPKTPSSLVPAAQSTVDATPLPRGAVTERTPEEKNTQPQYSQLSRVMIPRKEGRQETTPYPRGYLQDTEIENIIPKETPVPVNIVDRHSKLADINNERSNKYSSTLPHEIPKTTQKVSGVTRLIESVKFGWNKMRSILK